MILGFVYANGVSSSGAAKGAGKPFPPGCAFVRSNNNFQENRRETIEIQKITEYFADGLTNANKYITIIDNNRRYFRLYDDRERRKILFYAYRFHSANGTNCK